MPLRTFQTPTIIWWSTRPTRFPTTTVAARQRWWRIAASDFGDAERQDNFARPEFNRKVYRASRRRLHGKRFDRDICVRAPTVRTAPSQQPTFYMTNMIPQTPDLNRNVWNDFETYSRDLVKKGKVDLYVVAAVTAKREAEKEIPCRPIAGNWLLPCRRARIFSPSMKYARYRGWYAECSESRQNRWAKFARPFAYRQKTVTTFSQMFRKVAGHAWNQTQTSSSSKQNLIIFDVKTIMIRNICCFVWFFTFSFDLRRK